MAADGSCRCGDAYCADLMPANQDRSECCQYCGYYDCDVCGWADPAGNPPKVSFDFGGAV